MQKRRYFVHRLVAKAFINNEESKFQVNHKDGNKQNNIVSNLEWVTCKENIRHAFDVLGHEVRKGINQGELCGKAVLTERDVLNIRQSKLSGRKLAKIYNVSSTQINRIKNRQSWGWL